jgi:hypothetical protein
VRQFAIILTLILTLTLAGAAIALADAPATAPAQDVDPGRLRAAVERALPAVRNGLKIFSEKKALPPPEVLAKVPEAYRCFDAGFPHGKSQFISLPATCYAAMALALAAEPPTPAR